MEALIRIIWISKVAKEDAGLAKRSRAWESQSQQGGDAGISLLFLSDKLIFLLHRCASACDIKKDDQARLTRPGLEDDFGDIFQHARKWRNKEPIIMNRCKKSTIDKLQHEPYLVTTKREASTGQSNTEQTRKMSDVVVR